MKRFFLFVICMVASTTLGIAANDATEQAYTVETVPNVHVANRMQYVSDPSGILPASARDTINAMFAQLEKETGIETAVVMLPSIGQDEPFEFSHRLFRHWGIGKKGKDNGLLILFVADQHNVRFTTGYGIEGFLTDATSKRIQTRYMVPAFKRGDWAMGMVNGSRAVCEKLKDSMRPDAKADNADNGWNYAIFAIIVLFVIYLVYFGNRRQRKCPHCGKNALSPMSVDYYKGANGHRIRKEVFVCKSCGHVVVKNTDMDDEDRNGGSGLGSFLGGFLLGSLLNSGRGGNGGGFGGGGFSGGSFGGGDSGGGGADSSW